MFIVVEFLTILLYASSYHLKTSRSPYVSKWTMHKYQLDKNLICQTYSRARENRDFVDEGKEKLVEPSKVYVTSALILSSILLFPSCSHALEGKLYSQPSLDVSLRYFLAGGICASFSHAISVPFDVIKTKKQTNSEFTNLSVLDAAKKITEVDGLGMLLTGLGPTIVGYLVQGSLKYGFYELFKPIASLELANIGVDNNIAVFIIAGILAETIGSTFLSPFEASRIRLVVNPSFATGLLSCVNKMLSTEGMESLFRGLPAILAKQIPYTVVQLSSFETLTSKIYSWMTENGIDISTYKLPVSFAAALAAAIMSSLASQPGDTLLSVVNKSARVQVASTGGDTSSSAASGGGGISGTLAIMRESVAQLGVVGLFRGTKARLLHVGVIVVVQLLVYDFVKECVGLPVTGMSH